MKPGRAWILWAIVVLTLGTIASGMALVYFRSVGNLTSAQTDIDAIGKLGVPTTYGQLAELCPSEGSDAAEIYAKFAKRKYTPDEWRAARLLDPLTRKRPSEQDKLAAANTLRRVLQPLIGGSALVRWSILPIPRTSGSDADDSVMSANLGAYFLCHMAIVDIESGQEDMGFGELQTCERISAQLCRNPEFSSGMYGMEIDEAVGSACVRIALAEKNRPDILRHLLAVLREARPRPSARTLYSSLFVKDAYYFKGETGSEFWSEHINDEMDELQKALRAKQLEALGFHMWREEFRALPKGDFTWEQADAVFKQAANRHPDYELRDSGQEVALDLARDSKVWRVRHGLTVTGIEILLETAEQGHPPASVPSGPDAMDLFSGKAFGYKRDATGFRVYSVGLDGQDDGGKTSSESRDHHDIVMKFD